MNGQTLQNRNDGFEVTILENDTGITNIDLIDKKYVHKKKEENVLIYNLRRKLPRKIPKEIFQKLLTKLNSDDAEFLLRFYSDKERFFSNKEPVESRLYFSLQALPVEITKETALDIVKKNKLSLGQVKTILQYYKREKGFNKYVLQDSINEEEELLVLQILDLKDLHITDDEKARLSGIFESVKDVEKTDIVYSNMYVKVDHDFFFEHPNEHVPALMLIESSRQFLISSCHKYFNIPFSDVSFILAGMEVKFFDYLEMNYPIKFKGVVNSIKYKRGYATYINYDVHVYQKNKLCSAFNYIGKSVRKSSFMRLRNSNFEQDKNPRFYPRDLLSYNIYLKDDSNQKNICKILDISVSGFKLKFNSNFVNENTDIEEQIEKRFEFFSFFEGIGLFVGECSLKWIHFSKEAIYAGFEITKIADEDKTNLTEALKRCCYVKEQREIL